MDTDIMGGRVERPRLNGLRASQWLAESPNASSPPSWTLDWSSTTNYPHTNPDLLMVNSKVSPCWFPPLTNVLLFPSPCSSNFRHVESAVMIPSSDKARGLVTILPWSLWVWCQSRFIQMVARCPHGDRTQSWWKAFGAMTCVIRDRLRFVPSYWTYCNQSSERLK